MRNVKVIVLLFIIAIIAAIESLFSKAAINFCKKNQDFKED
jgi:hypothetical protein